MPFLVLFSGPRIRIWIYLIKKRTDLQEKNVYLITLIFINNVYVIVYVFL